MLMNIILKNRFSKKYQQNVRAAVVNGRSHLNRFDVSVEECLELHEVVVGRRLHKISLGLTQFLLRLTAFHQRVSCASQTVTT